jgi:ElaB/YqjD/DUF883 family membrane-anchored ribosome-binding protein
MRRRDVRYDPGQETKMSDYSRTADSAGRSAEKTFQNSAQSVKDTARDAAQSIKDQASSALSKGSDIVRDQAGRAASAGSDAAQSIVDRIQDQPVAAAVMCLGIGFLAGILISRRI